MRLSERGAGEHACMLHRFIAAQAGPSIAGYQLLAGFPARPLLDDSATLEAAGLLNSVVMQQWKLC